MHGHMNNKHSVHLFLHDSFFFRKNITRNKGCLNNLIEWKSKASLYFDNANKSVRDTEIETTIVQATRKTSPCWIFWQLIFWSLPRSAFAFASQVSSACAAIFLSVWRNLFVVSFALQYPVFSLYTCPNSYFLLKQNLNIWSLCVKFSGLTKIRMFQIFWWIYSNIRYQENPVSSIIRDGHIWRG